MVRLKKIFNLKGVTVNRLSEYSPSKNKEYTFNNSHFHIEVKGRRYSLGYKMIKAEATSREYLHINRYGGESGRSNNIQPGKYALGNNPNKISDWSTIQKVYTLSSMHYTFFMIKWKRNHMKTLISIKNNNKNEWKVETITASEGYYLQDLYF